MVRASRCWPFVLTGNGVYIRQPGHWYCMVTRLNLATQSGAHGSALCLKLVGALRSDCLEIGWMDKNNALSAGVSGALLIALENGGKDLFAPRSCP